MSKRTESIPKTSRLLVVFHLFQHCREVSFKEITDMLPVSQKTVYRDIQTLKKAGGTANPLLQASGGVCPHQPGVHRTGVAGKSDTETLSGENPAAVYFNGPVG